MSVVSVSSGVMEQPGETGLDVHQIRAAFPILQRTVHGKPLVYLDNAASTQKPSAVIDRVVRLYEAEYANIHRGVHWLSGQSTQAYENSRETVRSFLNARDAREIVFVRGTTEAVNLLANTYGREHIQPGDEVLITAMEHHSNIVPWQMLCEAQGATLRVAPINDRGELELETLINMMTARTKLVAAVHVSNALGTINPVETIIEQAHQRNIPVFLDGAQAAPHLKVDVQALDVDFFAFSGHKVYGPSGVGVLYGRAELLERMPPYQGGGDMIATVTFEKSTYADIPAKFEAGTPNIAGAIGLASAIDFMRNLGLNRIAAHEANVLQYGIEALASVPGLRLVGTAAHKASVLSFVLEGIHAHDVGTLLDLEGIAVRTGHHCAQPVMDFFGVPATTRASLGVYNTTEDVDLLVRGLYKVRKVFGS